MIFATGGAALFMIRRDPSQNEEGREAAKYNP